MIVAAALASAFALIDRTQGELPRTVVPLAYRIDIDPNPTAMTIAGNETIRIIVRAPERTITLNALQMRFTSVTLDGRPARVTLDPAHQQAHFTFARTVAAGTHELAIRYVATLQTAAQGLFKQRYNDIHNKPTYMYGTQLEATDARRLFPSFDEPVFKTPFTMSFVVPKAWTAVSNTPIVATTPVGSDRKRVLFAPTPKMSTYLVVLCAGDFDHLSATADGVKLGVYVPHGEGPQGAYALHVMQQLMPYYDAYYGVHFPIPKLDTIAIPGGFLGAMENWGGITYNDSTILYDPKVQPASAKREIFGIIAHEESHQWNGDLTTFAWWDDVWIAEGFATWMQTKAPDHFHPDWHTWLTQDGAVQGAMVSDAQMTTHPIYTPVRNVTEAAAVFDSISYTKAGQFLRMLEEYIGKHRFQLALQHYFRTHEYTSFSAADLWNDIGAQGHANVTAIAKNWIHAPGFPLVSATATCVDGKRSVTLRQQRYMSDVAQPTGSTVWSIPMNVQFDGTSSAATQVLFNRKTQTIAAGSCDTPLVLNGNAVGFFRTQYDDATRSAQEAAFTKLSTADRLDLLSDASSFAANGYAKIDQWLAYAKADAGDTNPYVVRTVVDEYQRMIDLEKGKPGEAAAKAYVIAQIKPMFTAFGGWDGTGMNDDQLAVRNSIVQLLADCDDPGTIAEGKARFAKLMADPTSLTPLNRTAVLAVAGYAADPAIYGQLFHLALAATNPAEQEQYFFAVYSAKDPALATQSLESTLHLPPQDASYAPYIVLYVGQQHPHLAWSFLEKHANALFATMSAFERAQAVTTVAAAFATRIPSADIAAFMKAHVPADGAPEVRQALDRIHTRETVQQRLLPQIDAAVAAAGAKS
jgi:aminopeptidase N